MEWDEEFGHLVLDLEDAVDKAKKALEQLEKGRLNMVLCCSYRSVVWFGDGVGKCTGCGSLWKIQSQE